MGKKRADPSADSGQARPEIKRLKLSELRPARYNPRRISDEALAGLAKSLERFGCVEPLVVNVKGGRNTVVGGHQRLKVLLDQGAKTVNCVAVELSLKEEKALNVSLNNPAIQGEFIEGIEEYLEQVRAGIGDGAFVELRLAELRGEIAAAEGEGNGPEVAPVFSVVCECKNQREQKRIHTELTKRGYQCRLLTL